MAVKDKTVVKAKVGICPDAENRVRGTITTTRGNQLIGRVGGAFKVDEPHDQARWAEAMRACIGAAKRTLARAGYEDVEIVVSLELLARSGG